MGRNSSGGGGAAGGGAGRGMLEPFQWRSLGGGLEIRSVSSDQFDTIEFRLNGQSAGRLQYDVNRTTGRAEINDTLMTVRGQRLVDRAFPAIERNMKARGAKYISATVVDRAVGEKVWKAVGFKETSAWNGRTAVWRKEL